MKIWNKIITGIKLYYFNPGHETAVLNGSDFYTPPKHTQKMTRDLAFLPAWYANSGDYVLITEGELSDDFLNSLPKEIRPQVITLNREYMMAQTSAFPTMEASPWGMTPQCMRMFKQLKEEFMPELAIAEWNDRYCELLGRKTAAICLEEMRKRFRDYLLPETPKFCSSLEEVKSYLKGRDGNYILKAPYSSSGRGLYRLREGNIIAAEDANRIRGIIRKQGIISIERALDKQVDFALEFFSDGKGKVSYEGISVFQTNEKGAYKGNLLTSQSRLWNLLEEYVSHETLATMLDATAKAVEAVYGNSYTGYLGVDMLIYGKGGDFYVHPCIEVNLRYTMGLIALRLFDSLLDENASASLHIIYSKRSAPELDYEMKKANPLIIADGKISEGYMSLCPVTKETSYIAYILAGNNKRELNALNL